MGISVQDLECIFVSAKHELVRDVERRTRDRAEAEDIVQEAFCRALTMADTLDPDRVPAWLATVAKNLAVDSWRKKQKEVRLNDSLPARAALAPDHSDRVVDKELARAASGFIATLPAAQRDALLGLATGLSVAQIALSKRRSKRSVEGHLRRGRHLVRRWATV